MFVTNSLTGGGAERAMNLAANELSKRNWPIALVPINSSGPDFVEPICEVFPVNRTWRGTLLNTIRAFFRFQEIIHSWKPDIVVVTCDLPEFYGAFLFHRSCIVVVEEASAPWGTRKSFGRLVRFILRMRGALWVAASPHLTIWPNGRVPDAVLQNIMAFTDELNGDDLVEVTLQNLIYIGRLSAEKRPDWFVEICSKGNFQGILIGDGPLKESLIKQDKATNAQVQFKGYLPNPWSNINKDQLLIVPSASEGDGLVVIEAMKANLPLLISDIPDFRRFNFPEKHYCKSPQDFILRIEQYQTDLHSLIVPVTIKERILNERTPQVVGDSWVTFLEGLNK